MRWRGMQEEEDAGGGVMRGRGCRGRGNERDGDAGGGVMRGRVM